MWREKRCRAKQSTDERCCASPFRHLLRSYFLTACREVHVSKFALSLHNFNGCSWVDKYRTLVFTSRLSCCFFFLCVCVPTDAPPLADGVYSAPAFVPQVSFGDKPYSQCIFYFAFVHGLEINVVHSFQRRHEKGVAMKKENLAPIRSQDDLSERTSLKTFSGDVCVFFIQHSKFKVYTSTSFGPADIRGILHFILFFCVRSCGVLGSTAARGFRAAERRCCRSGPPGLR